MAESEVFFSSRAYAKMVLHAAKYPHCAVNGLLLTAQSGSSRELHFTDCIPLFHQIQGLTPMLEVALTQIDAVAKAAGLAIAGYYHANELLKNTNVDVFSQRIADKISDHVPSAALVTIDNKQLGLAMNTHGLIVQQSWEGKWRNKEKSKIVLDEGALPAVSALLQKKVHKAVMDYDNHLDDVSRDFLNVEINMEIDQTC